MRLDVLSRSSSPHEPTLVRKRENLLEPRYSRHGVRYLLVASINKRGQSFLGRFSFRKHGRSFQFQ